MEKKLLYFSLIFTILISLAGQPVLAQEASPASSPLATTLAEATAKGFLVTLTRPELAATRNFYLLEEASASSALEELRAVPVTGYQITQSGWLDTTSYQVLATLEPGPRSLAITTTQYNGRWRVADLELTIPAQEVKQAAAAANPAGTSGPHPVNPGLAGRLVFQTTSGGDIYTLNANGTGLRRLTHGLDPQLSPDGTQVTFTRWEPRYELFTINLDGSGERAWTQGWRQMKAPTWSADGRSLVFSYQSGGRLEDEEHHIDLLETAMEEEGVEVPSEARDVEVEGETLSYRLPMDAHWYLKQVDLNSQALRDLPSGQYAYSPAGHPSDPNLLVYTVGGRGIALYDAASQTSRPVTTDPNDRAPVLSPDGRRVAVSYWQNGHWEIHTFNLDGSHRQRLTQTPASVLVQQSGFRTELVEGKERLVPAEQRDWNNAAPAWSPDGQQLAFLTDRSGRWEIWLMQADGSNQRPMFPNGVLDNLTLEYHGVDEHMLSWR